jgi:hypothetical protein
VEKLHQAVKFAREEANDQPADEQKVGRTVLSLLFA